MGVPGRARWLCGSSIVAVLTRIIFFPWMNFIGKTRPRYYRELDAVRKQGEDLTGWLEYAAEGLLATLEHVWTRVQSFSAQSTKKKLVSCAPSRNNCCKCSGTIKSMMPSEIWSALNISKQGALDLLRPLIAAGLVKRVGSKKSGRYILA